ncbi:MAG: metalloregulator ArsR/SmtB family transcription factor [Eubacteriales bacterium]|nr:metalloregulator ArsR/SmtB family transcription factor [Eubacteriales bacterium]
MKKDETEFCEINSPHEESVKKAKASLLDTETLYDVAELFKIFGDSTRTSILATLSSGEMCVCDIAEVLNLSVSAVSHQLRILRHNKLVKARRCGKEVFYSLSDDHVVKILETATEHVKE